MGLKEEKCDYDDTGNKRTPVQSDAARDRNTESQHLNSESGVYASAGLVTPAGGGGDLPPPPSGRGSGSESSFSHTLI